MRAHNRGDGGIMALASLLQRDKATRVATLVTLGIFGAALFFGDGIITPAISVLGSVQGLKVVEPQSRSPRAADFGCDPLRPLLYREAAGSGSHWISVRSLATPGSLIGPWT